MKIKVLYVFTRCIKSGPTQQMLNLIKNLDRDIFDPYLVTLYPENTDGLSILDEYMPVLPHRMIPMSKKQMMFGSKKDFKKYLDELKPDVVHTLGVFPDYLLYRLKFKNHVLTSRNYVYADYPDQYGKMLGTVLAKIHLRVIKNTEYACCCSESLHNIYFKNLKLDIPFVRNGVDLSRYYVPKEKEKKELRERFKLPLDAKIMVYGAVFNDRKNQRFLLSSFAGKKEFEGVTLLLLGDGAEYEGLKEEYGKYANILMPGNTTKMADYLRASDYYVSTSKSEGLPNGVLEAMATGLPILLSDIPQHLEVLNADNGVGYAYEQENSSDFAEKLSKLLQDDYDAMSKNAITSVQKHFSAQVMSGNYQTLYKRIVKE